MKLRCALFCAAALCLVPRGLPAAEPPRDTTLIPQTVYVGDRARLFVPLETVLGGAARESVVIDRRELLPRSSSVDVHRFEIERRPSGDRAIIDFTAFEAGTVTLPALDAGGVRLAGLRVSIASSLEPGASSLSPPEEPLAAPGTFALIYAGLFALLAAGAGAFFIFARLLPWYASYRAIRRRGLAARSMRRVLDRLASEADRMEPAAFLNALFDELRSYLTQRTGINCHTLTAAEYPSALALPNSPALLSTDDLRFLESLFRRGDEVRFGSSPAAGAELKASIERVSQLVDRVEALPC